MAKKKRFKIVMDTTMSTSERSDIDKEYIDLLWRKVIIQAVRDAGSANAKTRAEIYRWLCSVEYKKVCALASMNHTLLKRGLLSLMETAENFPRVMVIKSVEALESEIDNLSLLREARLGLKRPLENGDKPADT